MGQVFTWDEVRKGQVPNLQDFSVVLRQLQDVLSREPSILAAGVCGSVVRGDHSRRSDIDCVVIYDGECSRRAFPVMQELSIFAHRRHVPLSFVENDSRMVQTRMHHLGPSFVEHMGFSMRDGGLIKGRPMEMLAPSVTRQQGIEEYLRFKMHYLQSHWAAYTASTEPDRMQFLQKSLEAPMHVARKVLSWFGPLSGDSKRFVFEQYHERMPDELGRKLSKFVSIDAEYTTELNRQLEKSSKSDYATMLEYIEAQVPEVLEFVIQNLIHINNAARP